MEAAVRRLRETNDPIATIALDCGYSDQSAFSRQFRQTTGLSPQNIVLVVAVRFNLKSRSDQLVILCGAVKTPLRLLNKVEIGREILLPRR